MKNNRVNQYSDSAVIDLAYFFIQYPNAQGDMPVLGVKQQKLFDLIMDHVTQRAKKK